MYKKNIFKKNKTKSERTGDGPRTTTIGNYTMVVGKERQCHRPQCLPPWTPPFFFPFFVRTTDRTTQLSMCFSTIVCDPPSVFHYIVCVVRTSVNNTKKRPSLHNNTVYLPTCHIHDP